MAKSDIERRAELRKWFHELKASLACEECGISHPAVIEFHHRDKKTKKYNVSQMVNRTLNQQAILREIAKCAVLCANCHKVHHYIHEE
jgi:hypothetical protein